MSTSRRHAIAATAVSDTGAAQISGALTLEMTLSPSVAQPGDTVQLLVSLTNFGQSTQLPEVTLIMPSSLTLESRLLPQGMTLNLAKREMEWLPVLPANGGVASFELPVRVETADIVQPEQLVTAVMQIGEETFQAEAGLWVGIPPRVESILTPSQVAVGQPIQLRLETSGSAPISQSWELGDGRQVDVVNPSVVYPLAGIYQIRAQAANAVGTSQARQSITVVPHPAAQFHADDFSVAVDQPISFINQSGGQPPLFYQWDFGDGVTADGYNPVHSYAQPGVYQVRLQVENEYGRSEAVWPVTVGQPPLADMTIPETVPAGQPFTGLASGDGTVSAYSWNMGDGQIYEGVQISHVYRQIGDFYVILTAGNEYGGTDIGRWIHVDPGLFNTYLPLIFKALSEGSGVVGNLDQGVDPALSLPEVTLDAPFVLAPLELPGGLTEAEKLFVYINEARGQFDLPPLNMVQMLNVASQQHTDDMAQFAYTGHVGSDGSTPAERLLWHQYPAGYAGEATAWGFEQPYQAVEFWVNSPSHRRIILNEFATDVGVGHTVNFGAPNVWYWTAEFGNQYSVADAPLLRLRSPIPEASLLNTDVVQFAWNWPLPLVNEQTFELTMVNSDGVIVFTETISAPRWGTYYLVEPEFLAYPDAVGELRWHVVLVQGTAVQLQSDSRPILIAPDPSLPTPTPEIATPGPATPTPLPTITPSPTNQPANPQPTNPPLPPPLVTATPQP